MASVKRAVNAQKKRRTTLERASGYRGQRSRLYRKAKEQVLHSLQLRLQRPAKRKGDFRQLWITRINAAARANGMTYNRFMQGLKVAGVEVDRKVLAELAVSDAAAFAALVAHRAGGAAGRRVRRLSLRHTSDAAPALRGRRGVALSADHRYPRGARSSATGLGREPGPGPVRAGPLAVVALGWSGVER